jgi:DNA-directed RNA polymerase subunit RPC12/RpoP
MNLKVTCILCGREIDVDWLLGLPEDSPFACPYCDSMLMDTACVETGVRASSAKDPLAGLAGERLASVGQAGPAIDLEEALRRVC